MIKKITKTYYTIKGFFIEMRMRKELFIKHLQQCVAPQYIQHKKKKPINFGKLVC